MNNEQMDDRGLELFNTIKNVLNHPTEAYWNAFPFQENF